MNDDTSPERPERHSKESLQVSEDAINQMLDSSRDYDVFEGDYYETGEADALYEALEARLEIFERHLVEMGESGDYGEERRAGQIEADLNPPPPVTIDALNEAAEPARQAARKWAEDQTPWYERENYPEPEAYEKDKNP